MTPTQSPTINQFCDFRLFSMYQENLLIDNYTYVTKNESVTLSAQIISQYNRDGGFRILTPFNPSSCCLDFSEDFNNFDGYSFDGSPFIFVCSTNSSKFGFTRGSPCSTGSVYNNPDRLFKFAPGPHPATKQDTLNTSAAFGVSTNTNGCTRFMGGVSLVKFCDEELGLYR